MAQLGHDPLEGSLCLGMRRRVTAVEANRALVLVKRIVADVVRHYGRLLDLQETIEAALAAGARTQFGLARDALVRAAGELHQCLSELQDVGVEVRDYSQGIVDFPCVVGGREVCLCWQHGEGAVAHWHEADEGFAQRRPIEQLESWELLVAPR